MKPVFPIIFFFLLFQQNRAQVSPGYAEYCTKAILQKTNLTYRVQHYELDNGKVIHGISGEVTLIRHTDTLFGYLFRVKTDTMEVIFDGKLGFVINNQTQRVKQVNAQLLHDEAAVGLLFPVLVKGFGEPGQYSCSVQGEPSDEVIEFTKIAKQSREIIYAGKQDFLPRKIEVEIAEGGKKKRKRTIVTGIEYNRVPEDGIVSRLIELLDTHLLEPLDRGNELYSSGNDNTLIGREAPDFRLPDFNGKYVGLRDFRGKIVLLNFWEPWCGPCRMSISYLQEFVTKLNTDDLVILNLTKDNIDFSRKLIQDRKISLPNLISNEEVNKVYDVYVIPQYFLIDKRGRIIYASREGYEKKMEDLILQFLE
ncbi:MAG: TlpA family protein disulfide reductase [Chitinophagales bacterium]|nr:TlpA family protein disulfide reductase [Chitinophagales bacterium]